MSFQSLILSGVVLISGSAGLAQGQSIDLSGWQTIQYEFQFQPDANWALQPGNTEVLQTVNSDASIFVGDFDAAGQEIRGTWRVETTSDDDFMGFVFGYQGRGQYYLFDWKQLDQNHEGFAEAGMSLKVVDMPSGSDPTAPDLWATAGSANVAVLRHNTIPWDEFVDYEFALVFVAGNIEITVSEGPQELEHWVVADATFTNGPFGFYNYSQDAVRYTGFTQQGVPTTFYCTAKTNSQGCVPTLAVSGTASLSDPTPFDVSAALLINNRSGVLTYGLNGPAATPFQGGFLCVEPPLLHAPVSNTFGNAPPDDCSGTLSFDFNAWIQGGNSPSVTAGSQVNAQYVYRDLVHMDGSGHGLTEGVQFVVQP